MDLMKMDVEGGEYRVLQGATRVLRELRPVIVAELNSVCLKRDHHTPEDVIQLLQAAAYQTFSFNDGVLAIPGENSNALNELRACAKNSIN